MKIYNSMSRQKEEFVPIQPGKVSIYACGPTVYNFIHIGNARPHHASLMCCAVIWNTAATR